MLAFRFQVDGKHFPNRPFLNGWSNNSHAISMSELFFKHKSKMVGACCLFKYLRWTVDKNKVMCFQSETSIFKFLGHTVVAWMGKHYVRAACPKASWNSSVSEPPNWCVVYNVWNTCLVPLWCLNLIQVIYNRHLITGFLPCGICTVFCKLQEVTNDILKWYNVNLLADQLVLIQSLLSDMASSEIDTQLQVLEKNGFVDLVLPCAMFLAFNDIIQSIQSWLFLSNFDKL